MKVDASIVIPTFNRALQLDRVLGALEQQGDTTSFEVIVVDDGSEDDTAHVLTKRRSYHIVSLRQPNGGPGAARNEGVRRASGELIIFIDDDVVPAPDLVREHIETQRHHSGVVIGALRQPRTRQPAWADWECRTLDRQYQAMVAGDFEPTPRQFYTANASVPRSALLEVGLFDSAYKRAEDVELAYRLLDAGLSFYFNHRANVTHDTPRSFNGWRDIAAAYGTYDVRMWRDGRTHILRNIAEEFEGARNPATKILAKTAVGRPVAMRAVRDVGAVVIQVLSRFGLRQAATKVCGAYFNTLYLDAVSAELGGRESFWRALKQELQKDETPFAEPARG